MDSLRARAAGRDDSDADIVGGPINVRNTSLIILTVIAVTASLYLARAFFMPLVLGVLISYTLYPVVSFMDRRAHLPRPLGAGVVVVAVMIASSYAVIALQEQLVELLDKAPAALERVNQQQRGGEQDGKTLLDKLQEAATEIENAADNAVASASSIAPTDGSATSHAGAGGPSGMPGTRSGQPVRVVIDRGSGRYMNYVLNGSFGFLVMIGQAITVLLMVYFALASGNLYKHKLVKVSGDSLTKKKITLEILEDINRQLRLFLFVTLIGAIFVGIATGIAFWWLGVEQAMLWGVIAGTASVVPYVGPAIVFVLSGITAFLQFGSLGQGMLIAVVSLVITSVQGNLLTPWMTSRAASMNAVAIFIVLLFWGWLWGPIGLIVATPILMVIKAVCDHIENLQGIGEFISNAKSGSPSRSAKSTSPG